MPVHPSWSVDTSEPDLQYADDQAPSPEEDAPVPVAARYERTTELPPGAGTVDWSEIERILIEHRLSKGRNADGTPKPNEPLVPEDDEDALLEMGVEIDIADLPNSPQGYAKRARAAGWEVRAGRSRTHKAAVLYQDDSKSKEGKEAESHQAGDVRYPPEDDDHFVVAGHLQRTFAFWLYFTTRHKHDRDKPETSFDYGRLLDPMDGRIFIVNPVTMKAFSPHANLSTVFVRAEFDEWLDALIPREKPRAKKKTEAEKLLGGEDWNG